MDTGPLSYCFPHTLGPSMGVPNEGNYVGK